MKAARISGFIVSVLWLGAVAGAAITPISQKLDYTHNYNVYLQPDSDPNRIVFVKPWATTDNSDPTNPDVIDHWPWHRLSNMDWGWTHSIVDRVPADAIGIDSATLAIEAWDVNADAVPPEIDEVSANGTVLGSLDGTSIYQWGTTTFTLPASVVNDLWLYGEVYIFINIDKLLDELGHRVTLGSSTLTVNYLVSGPGRGAVEPIFRFWSPTLSHHFYTTAESERNGVIQNMSGTWSRYEGPVYYLPVSDPDAQPVYRFWSSTLSAHFYTISEEEKNGVLATYPTDVWQLEGVVFYAFPPGQQPADSKPVYRFWSNQYGTHFYTISEEEKDFVIANYDAFWQYETIAWYAYE